MAAMRATCLCGGVEIEVTGKLGPVVYCHCSRCQKASGSAFSASADVRRRYWNLSGEELLREFESSPGVLRAFCSRCGSPIYSRRKGEPDSYRLRLAATSRDLGDSITARIGEATEILRSWSDPVSIAGHEFGENISQRIDELTETLRSVSQPLANTRRDLVDNINIRITELSDSLKSLSDPLTTGGKDLAASISGSINELTEMLNGVVLDAGQRSPIKK